MDTTKLIRIQRQVSISRQARKQKPLPYLHANILSVLQMSPYGLTVERICEAVGRTQRSVPTVREALYELMYVEGYPIFAERWGYFVLRERAPEFRTNGDSVSSFHDRLDIDDDDLWAQYPPTQSSKDGC
ncbi:hypothetical protein CO610_00745 [Lysobacteraceae bacterium NML95-0200]|nr:hypothetical protein CO610_00745 [Xanthomonadaceae bacterium NML95-0200]